MGTELNWAVLGTGVIANQMAQALQKMGKPTKSGTRMTFAPVRSAGEYEAEMQRILEDGKKLGLKFEKKKEEK